MNDEMMKLFNDIHDEVDTLDGYDIHTHINWDKPQVQSAVPIMFYHFVHFEMKAAGLTEWTDHIRDAEIKDVRRRIIEALPYYEKIRFSGSYFCLKRVLQDLYGMKTETPTEAFVDSLIEQVEHNKNDANWPREVFLKRAHIKQASINILDYPDWPGKIKAKNPDTMRYADMFYPSMEQGDFVLLPADRICKSAGRRSGIPVTDAASLAKAIHAYATPEEFNSIKSFLGWSTLQMVYSKVNEQTTDAAIKKALSGQPVTNEENNAVSVWCLHHLFDELKKRNVVYQMFFGSEFVPGGVLREPAITAYKDNTLLNFAAMVCDYPDNRFDLLIGNSMLSHEANIMVKNFPNLNIGGIWWHNMYPAYLRKIMAERLDVCPVTKVSGFFSDGYNVEWAYGKRKLVQREFAWMLTEKISQGYISRADASYIAKMWWWENPKNYYGK